MEQNGAREFIADTLKQLHFDYSEITSIYQRTTFAINGTIFAISSAGIGYTITKGLGVGMAIPFYVAIIIGLLTSIFSRHHFNKRRKLYDSMIADVYERFLSTPNQMLRMNEANIMHQMGELFKPKRKADEDIGWVNAVIWVGNFASPFAFVIGLSLLVFKQ